MFRQILKSIFLLSSVLGLNSALEAYDNQTKSKYEDIRQFFPTVNMPNNDAMNWRSVENDYRNHPCKRKCEENEAPQTCYYYMVVHYDETMSPACNRYLQQKYRFTSNGKEYIDPYTVYDYEGFDDCKYADGVQSEVMVINGLLPGQNIEVCVGDSIVADVINSMHEMTSIHWHGMHQRKTPHMDGVPHVTQYPIEAGQAYRYRFEVDHAGTHWWHSHTDHQRSYGLSGALVVRQPNSLNGHAKLYDFDLSEHTLLVQDWVHDFVETVPQNILINGLGRNVQGKGSRLPTLYETLTVERGGRYRIRVIFNGIGTCPITLSIDDHDLLVISSDGNDIEPIKVQKLTIHGGERFDFVLHANQEDGNYWLRVKGYKFCEINSLSQEAVLHYMGANRYTLPAGDLSYHYEAPGIELNPVDIPLGRSDDFLTMNDITAYETRLQLPLTPQHVYYTAMSNGSRGQFDFQMDDISFTMPKISFLQTRNLGIHSFFCNKTQQASLGFNCKRRQCKCTNVIQVPAFKNIEFVVSSTSSSAHPIHLHGYTFRVVGMGVLGPGRIEQIEEIDRQYPFARRKRGGPLKDTVMVPGYGYTIIRFYADNPGYWIFHCHISIHSEHGMTAIIRVGEDFQMKMCPVSNCGLCSSVV